LTIWTPAPRECTSITEVNGFAYLIGGMNHDVIKDISRLKLKGLISNEIENVIPEWKHINYITPKKILGRSKHTSCSFEHKIYSFGGCFKYNTKRQIRECTSELTVFDTITQTY
jgi:hypothetical protein